MCVVCVVCMHVNICVTWGLSTTHGQPQRADDTCRDRTIFSLDWLLQWSRTPDTPSAGKDTPVTGLKATVLDEDGNFSRSSRSPLRVSGRGGPAWHLPRGPVERDTKTRLGSQCPPVEVFRHCSCSVVPETRQEPRVLNVKMEARHFMNKYISLLLENKLFPLSRM